MGLRACPDGGRQRLCSLSQLSPELAVSGPHVQEAGGRLQVAPLPLTDQLNVTIRPDAVRSSTKVGTVENAFLATEETTTSRLLASWHRAGISGVLDDLASGRAADSLPGWARRLVALLTTLVRLPYTASISSPLSVSVPGAPAGAVVRRVAWHPHTTRLAVVLRDDSIRVYQTQAPTVPLIKHRLQRRVADLHWKPHSASLLAVACERCVLVWTLEPNSVITRPPGSCAQTLTAPGHAPVSCVQWSPLGDLLVSASPGDGALILWNVAEETHVPLSRVWWLGNTLCRWSPDGSKVLGATTGQTFRVWETVRWMDERYRGPVSGARMTLPSSLLWTEVWETVRWTDERYRGPVSGARMTPLPSPVDRVWETARWTDERYRGPVSGARMSCACWSPDGQTALFATAGEPVVYSLSFVPILLNDSAPRPVPVIDLTSSPPEADETREARARREALRVGTEIAALSWDSTGRRLAVSFVDCNAVAIFATDLHPHLRITPCGVLRGSVDEVVMDITFQQNLQDTASLCVVSEQMELKQCQVRKFRSFLRKNNEAPFTVKKAVWDSALNASILYSCETWMTGSLKPVDQMYQHTLKDLVGVRYQTPSDLIYVETGIPPLSARVGQMQRNFLMKLQASTHFEGSPVQKAIQLARMHACPMGQYIEKLLGSPHLSSPVAALSEAWSSGRIQQVPMLVSATASGGLLGGLLAAAPAGPATPLRPSASLLSPSVSGASGLASPPANVTGSLMSPVEQAGGRTPGSILSPGGVQLFSVNDSP
ncbi:Aladin [Amphibalanus amphitrite]|uniref:Aladin n=1 Tax=Amphibalanus amphitrite TaxID=1232801 RepID=A0A6A4VCU2_AMPAM|nr:Aladin [Amphibalanus amphitrite]